MSWIKTISYALAEGPLKRLYDRVKGPDGNVDNVLLIHSLRPHTLTGHMTLYKSVLHNINNALPKWYLEALGVYVSHLNRCDYCFAHHFAGLQRLLQNASQAQMMRTAIAANTPENAFHGKDLAGMRYAHKLTLHAQDMNEGDVIALRDAGFSDGEILEINQVSSYFNYVNRSVVGLGVSTVGDTLGLSPNDSDDPKNWAHL